MNEHIAEILRRHKKSGALIDTNILLLFFVGSFDPELIPRFKRTKMFTIQDYETLVSVLGYFESIITTPHILTEVSNLSGQLPLRPDSQRNYFARFAHGIALFHENHFPSTEISSMQEFIKFGLSDTAIVRLARNNHLVITDDFQLAQYLQTQCIDVLNFNHIRIANW